MLVKSSSILCFSDGKISIHMSQLHAARLLKAAGTASLLSSPDLENQYLNRWAGLKSAVLQDQRTASSPTELHSLSVPKYTNFSSQQKRSCDNLMKRNWKSVSTHGGACYHSTYLNAFKSSELNERSPCELKVMIVCSLGRASSHCLLHRHSQRNHLQTLCPVFPYYLEKSCISGGRFTHIYAVGTILITLI